MYVCLSLHTSVYHRYYVAKILVSDFHPSLATHSPSEYVLYMQ